MSGLEIHTLNQGTNELPQALLSRVGAIAAGGATLPEPETAPDYPGVVLLLDDNLRASTGNKLSTIDQMIELRRRWMDSSTALGELASKTVISTTTGCWIKMSARRGRESEAQWRNSEGYVVVSNPQRFTKEGLTDSQKEHGMLLHRLSVLLLCQELGIEFILQSGLDGEHTCRNTACGNPYHQIGVTNDRNNMLRLKAAKVEKALVGGQMVMGSLGVDWVDRAVASAEQEDTGLVFATKEGPHRLIKLNHEPIIFYARREPDEVFDSLKPPARNSRNFKSRARLHEPIEGEDPMFVIKNDDVVPKPLPRQLYKESPKGY